MVTLTVIGLMSSVFTSVGVISVLIFSGMICVTSLLVPLSYYLVVFSVLAISVMVGIMSVIVVLLFIFLGMF